MPSERDFKVAVLASGRGTNLQAIIDEVASGSLDVELCMVLSDNPDAGALKRAERHGIPHCSIEQGERSQEEFEQEMVEVLGEAGADLIVLAGFMRILSPVFIRAFPEKIINIHPSLIPSFAGRGYYGERVHRAAIEYGVKISGCTVIFVNEEPDGGPIILQRAVPVFDDDTPKTLAGRILKEEHRLLPAAIAIIASGNYELDGRRVIIGDDVPARWC